LKCGRIAHADSAFRKLNEERERTGWLPSQIRVIFTAGTVRQLDSSVRRSDALIFFLTFFYQRSYLLRAALENVKRLAGSGFKVNTNRKLVHSMEDVWAFIQEWAGKRESLAYEIDGIVVKVDRTALQDELGLLGRLRGGPLL